jgi:hypothetical protein
MLKILKLQAYLVYILKLYETKIFLDAKLQKLWVI